MYAETLLLLMLVPAPLRAQTPADCAVLWVPEGPARAADVESYLSEPSARLTAAVSPDQVDRSSRLVELAAAGRLELALRIPGDPSLPLAGRRRPQDPLARIALARARHREAFGRPPEGFFPGDSGLTPDLAAALEAQGLRWAALPQPEASRQDAWPRSAGLTLVPASESAASTVRLARTLDAAPRCAATVAALAAAAPGGIPWTGGLPAWLDAPESAEGRALYDAAADALSEYQNSGQASLLTLEKATGQLYAAQDARFFRPDAPEPLRAELRARLEKVFKLLGRTPPELPVSSSSTAAQALPRLRVLREGDTLSFENAPAPSTATALWDLSRMRVAWDEGSLTFAFTLRASSPAVTPFGGFDRVLLEAYVDVNHRPGAGSTDLLPDRPGFLRSADGWEYVLVAGPSSAALYRYIAGQGPVLLETLRPQAEPGASELRVRVPRSRLRGDPARWGYLPLALETDKTAAALTPPRPLPAGACGLIAPTRVQEPPRDPALRYRRLPALRLTPGGNP